MDTEVEAKPEAPIPLSALSSGQTMLYQGKIYAQMHCAQAGARIVIDGIKRRANLWMCVEITGKFPARPVIVPEIL
jgi:hypothetical protein